MAVYWHLYHMVISDGRSVQNHHTLVENATFFWDFFTDNAQYLLLVSWQKNCELGYIFMTSCLTAGFRDRLCRKKTDSPFCHVISCDLLLIVNTWSATDQAKRCQKVPGIRCIFFEKLTHSFKLHLELTNLLYQLCLCNSSL